MQIHISEEGPPDYIKPPDPTFGEQVCEALDNIEPGQWLKIVTHKDDAKRNPRSQIERAMGKRYVEIKQQGNSWDGDKEFWVRKRRG